MKSADPADDADDEEQLWEDLVHVYEPMAQTCAAAGLNASAALYYGLCVDAVTQLPPRFVIDETSLASDMAPRITAARFVPMMLNQQVRARWLARDAYNVLCPPSMPVRAAITFCDDVFW